MSKQEKLEKTAMDIWTDIKDVGIDMFSLPNKKVSDFCEPVYVHPTKLYMKYKISSVITAMESIKQIGDKYTLAFEGNFLSVEEKK